MILASNDTEYFEDSPQYWQIDRLRSLLKYSVLDLTQQEKIELEISKGINLVRYEELENILFDNQVCRINAGFNYNMTDITRKINREI